MKFIHMAGDALRSYLAMKVNTDSLEGAEEILHSCKLLLYELFSNGVRHSPGNRLTLQFYYQMHYLAIEVETVGAPFTIRPSAQTGAIFPYPYPEEVIGKNIPVHLDENETIICHVLNDSCLEFTLRPTDTNGEFEIEVPEHFGLLLIVKLSEDVKYFHTQSGTNIFSIRKYFPQEVIK